MARLLSIKRLGLNEKNPPREANLRVSGRREPIFRAPLRGGAAPAMYRVQAVGDAGVHAAVSIAHKRLSIARNAGILYEHRGSLNRLPGKSDVKCLFIAPIEQEDVERLNS